MCSGNNVPDFSEIQKEFCIPIEFKEGFKKFIEEQVILAPNELITKPATRVLSNGPNGRPKWLTADVEAYALMNSVLHEPFQNICELTGNNDLYEYMKARSESQDRVSRKRLQYITAIRDKGNKCRLVAISDYWTQCLLEPIMMDTQLYIEKRFSKVSFSKNHVQGFNNLKKLIKPGYKSYDISS